jgi:phosphoglycerate-specific signal transduction histidine kinase
LDLNSVITETVRLVSTDVLSRESVVTTGWILNRKSAHLVQIQQVLLNLIINARRHGRIAACQTPRH